MSRIALIIVAILLMQGLQAQAVGQDTKTEVFFDGLSQPLDFVFHTSDDSILVCEFGDKRVSRIKKGKREDLVMGFQSSKHLTFDATGGPTSLAMIDHQTLLIASASDPALEGTDSAISLATYTIELDAEDASTDAAIIREQQLAIPFANKDIRVQINRIASGAGLILFAGQTSDGNGFIAQTDHVKPITNNQVVTEFQKVRLNNLKKSVPQKSDDDEWLSPVHALTISPEGYLAFVQNTDDGAKLVFSSEDGQRNGQFKTGLKQVTAIAYGPKRQRLFVADRATGAIYKLIESDNEAGCESIEMMKLPRVAAMKFNSDGELFVAQLGDPSDESSGKLLKISGLDEKPKSTKKAKEQS